MDNYHRRDPIRIVDNRCKIGGMAEQTNNPMDGFEFRVIIKPQGMNRSGTIVVSKDGVPVESGVALTTEGEVRAWLAGVKHGRANPRTT